MTMGNRKRFLAACTDFFAFILDVASRSHLALIRGHLSDSYLCLCVYEWNGIGARDEHNLLQPGGHKCLCIFTNML
ncbi:uncharacterized protein PHALS_14651 [Plasmopara halstedii]|uniref:Uncharacterized protein n=1 Tax=Plasmopara halstedii TaxID=4781 RepID=A0A0N7L5X7_PLAHL|nr:uncharacterized protein PHALS_14651 [Plasmopara halstedii]CEG42707.1 hypothetical protein PHALS_14651 [Plasmopara halstedii]|eukprot:XP_024579076.1 hypothetical protein PHALS_14651 [Plasmopara halstedii]